MSFKGIVRELKEMKDGIGNLSRAATERNNWRNRTRSHVAPFEAASLESVEQGHWANLPPELLLDIIRRLETSEISWPARTAVISCASVCKSWREITKEIVQPPEQCGRLTFPISIKQPGSREFPIQCFVKRDKATSTFRLFLGQTPSEDENDKLLLAARKMRRATGTVFVISLVSNDFSRSSNAYVGKLRSNFLGTKFTIYDNLPPSDATVKETGRSSQRFNSKLAPRQLPPLNYNIASISYELNVLRTRGPRRLHCVMHSIPISAIQEGGTAPTPKSLLRYFEDTFSSPSLNSKGKEPEASFSSTSLVEPSVVPEEPLVLKNKAPRWHEQLQCWCLNFRGRVTVASVKNFQLVAAVGPHHNVPVAEQEKVILQFGKIGKDIFTMDYHYPLSAFQAFAVCLSSFDTKPACE